MLSASNRKLGPARRIWTFSLPSRTTCPGRSVLCERLCYSHAIEQHRPSVRRRYQSNLQASQRSDFIARMIDFIRRRQVRIVRVHVGGDFPDATYARKWLTIMRRSPRTRFYFYSRSWRVPAIAGVLARMALLDNVRAWFSCDVQTGVPRRVPRNVRLAWLMSSPDDQPVRADLVFRVRRLRSDPRRFEPLKSGGRALVCPVENGVTGHRTSCEQCGVCWRPLTPQPSGQRLALPLVPARLNPES